MIKIYIHIYYYTYQDFITLKIKKQDIDPLTKLSGYFGIQKSYKQKRQSQMAKY